MRIFSQAKADDIGALEQLLNCCYRETAGWTNEADLVGGIRITPDVLASTITNPTHYLFVYPKTTTDERDAEETGEILGCIAVDIKTDADSNKKAYIGMFAVHPELQGKAFAMSYYKRLRPLRIDTYSEKITEPPDHVYLESSS